MQNNFFEFASKKRAKFVWKIISINLRLKVTQRTNEHVQFHLRACLLPEMSILIMKKS